MAASVASSLFANPPVDEEGQTFADLAGVSPFAALMVAETTAAAWRTRLSVMEGRVYDVRYRGADPTGVANAYQYIQDAIDEAVADGGGIVYIPPGTYLLEPTFSLSSSTSTYRQAVLAVGGNNVVIRGAARGATTLKLAEGGIYSAVQFIDLPLRNGESSIENCGIMDITLDGNYFGANQSGVMGLLHGSGTKNFFGSHVHVKNHGHYGVGFQSGGNDGLTLSHFVVENTMRDAIDIKNNPTTNGVTPSIGKAVKILHWTVRDVCKGNDGTGNSMGMIDVMSPGVIVNDVHVEVVPTGGGAVTPNINAIFRVKQGQDGDPSARGTGGQFAILSNITANVQSGGASVPYGVTVNAPYTTVSNAKVRGATTSAGIALLQPYCSVTGSTVTGSAAAGILARAQTGSILSPPLIDAWPWDGADDVVISGNTVKDCATGIMTQRAGTLVTNNIIQDCDLGFHGDSANATGLFVVGNSFSGNTADYTFDVTSGQTFHDCPGTDAPRRLVVFSGGVAGTAVHAARTAHRFQTGWDGTTASLKDGLRIEDVASAVNYWRMRASAAGDPLLLAAAGADTDIDLFLSAKGAGIIDLDGEALVRGDKLSFGALTASQVMLKRSTTQLHLRLADDSAYAAMDASAYRAGGTKVVGIRETGWGTPSGTADKTTFATSTVTLEELAKRVKAVIDALRVHGLIGA